MMNGDGVLEMSSRATVLRDDAPMVGKHIKLTCTKGYHRLDGNAKAVLKLLTGSSLAVIRHLRFFMHLTTNAVPYEFTYHSITSRLTM